MWEDKPPIPSPGLASDTFKYTSASDVVTPAQENNKGRQHATTLLDIVIPAFPRLPSHQEGNDLEASLWQCPQLIHPEDPIEY